MFKATEGEEKCRAELQPALPQAEEGCTGEVSRIEVFTDEDAKVIEKIKDDAIALQCALDSAAVAAEELMQSEYNLDNKDDHKKFVDMFGNRSDFRSLIKQMGRKRIDLKDYVVKRLIDGKIGGYIKEKEAILEKGVAIRREHDEKVAAAEADKRAEETARVERINAEIERIAARTDALVRLPGTMIGKDSVAIKAAIAEASADFQFQEESFFDEFLDAAKKAKTALMYEEGICLSSLHTLLASAEADEKAKAERAEAERAEAERKKVADLAAEAERIKQQQELEEANKITEILMSSVRLANSPIAEIRAGIEKISALTGSQKLLDAVSAAVSALQSALAAAERREAEEKEKAEAAEAARLKAAEEERTKREAAAAAEKEAKEEAAKKAAAEAEEKRKAKEAEEQEKARERQDADLTTTINAVTAVGIDIAVAEKLLMAVLLGEIPHLSWSNKC
jgi:hypothetical protein